MRQDMPNAPNKMGVMPVGKLLFSLSLPVMISMLTMACYNIVDSIFVARISENALTAVSLSFPVQMLMISVAVGTGVGMHSLISRRLGEKRFDEANSAAANGMFVMFLSALVFVAFGLTLVPWFFGMFTDNAEIYAMGVSYLSIVMIFCVGVFMQIVCERMLQATGNTIYPMIMQLVGTLTNIILDPILIFGYLGFPAMGITGAAIATVIGQLVAMCLSFYLVFFKKHDVKVSLRRFRPNWRIIKDIYKVGGPSIVLQSLGTVMMLGLNKILIAFTPTAVSVLGAYFKLNSFVFMPVFALTNGAMSIMAYNYGARDGTRIKQALRLGVIAAMSIMLVGILLFQLFARELLLLFDASADMLAIGIPALRIISWSFLFAGFSILVSHLFQAIGKGSYSMLMSLMRQIILILPLAYVFANVWGLDIVWWAFPAADIIGVALVLALYRRVNERMLKPIMSPPLDCVSPEEAESLAQRITENEG